MVLCLFGARSRGPHQEFCQVLPEPFSRDPVRKVDAGKHGGSIRGNRNENGQRYQQERGMSSVARRKSMEQLPEELGDFAVELGVLDDDRPDHFRAPDSAFQQIANSEPGSCAGIRSLCENHLDVVSNVGPCSPQGFFDHTILGPVVVVHSRRVDASSGGNGSHCGALQTGLADALQRRDEDPPLRWVLGDVSMLGEKLTQLHRVPGSLLPPGWQDKRCGHSDVSVVEAQQQ